LIYGHPVGIGLVVVEDIVAELVDVESIEVDIRLDVDTELIDRVIELGVDIGLIGE
jgi:hypothetical protein